MTNPPILEKKVGKQIKAKIYQPVPLNTNKPDK